jgi:hypothetical protein
MCEVCLERKKVRETKVTKKSGAGKKDGMLELVEGS